MPAVTPRGYPYPIDADPIDVAGDIQRLAESIDTDLGSNPDVGIDEVWVGTSTPPDALTELWYDTDDPGIGLTNGARGYVGHAFPTATTSITSTVVDITGSTVTWTADPTRRYRVSLTTYRIDQASAVGNVSVRITNAANSIINGAINTLTLEVGQFGFIHCESFVSGLSGSQSIKGRISTDAGSCTLQAGGVIYVEDVGDVNGTGASAPSTAAVAIQTGAYTPALGTIVVGTGGSARNDAEFTFVGASAVGSKGILSLSGLITFGTTGATLPAAGNETIALPPGFEFAGKLTNTSPVGVARLGAASSNFGGALWWASATTMRLVAINPATAGWIDVTATVPGTWAAGDQINWVMPGIEAVRV